VVALALGDGDCDGAGDGVPAPVGPLVGEPDGTGGAPAQPATSTPRRRGANLVMAAKRAVPRRGSRPTVVILAAVPANGDFDFSGIDVMTFDCYGTLVDWEAGILAALRPIVGETASDHDLLESYGRSEARLEAGPWQPYREILAAALAQVATGQGVRATDKQRADFGASVADWPCFPDSAAALAALCNRYQLGVITNCDDDLFAASSHRLGEPFTWIVTAEQVHSYKPDHRNFEVALERIGVARERVLHVAQSLYHDHVPAKRMGLKTAWIDRRQDRRGFGATPAAEARPDMTAPDMATFAELALS
jgi:2-haloacid dehalogenase